MDERVKAILSASIILIVNIAALCNISVDQNSITNVMFGGADLIVTIWAIWKNHNFTKEAAHAQQFLNDLKNR